MFWLWLSQSAAFTKLSGGESRSWTIHPRVTGPPLGLRTIEVEASNAHLCLILLLFNFKAECTEGNKQSPGPPCSHIPSSPPMWRSMWTHADVLCRECKGTDLIIKQHSSEAPTRHMTGFYLKEKCIRGETSSLKRILEKYIENSSLWQFFFFQLSGPILYLSFRCVFRGEGAGEMDVMKTNWQAVTIHPSWSKGELTGRGKPGSLLIHSRLLCSTLSSSFFSTEAEQQHR